MQAFANDRLTLHQTTTFQTNPNQKYLQTTKKKENDSKLKIDFQTEEYIVANGENAGYHHLLLFPQCFENALFSRSLKPGIVW